MKKGWEIKSLGDVATFSQGIQIGLEKHETNSKDGYVRFLRIIDYTQNTEDIRYVPNPGEKYFVNEEDIVMVRYGTPGLIGRGKSGVIANNLFRVKIERKDLTNDYLSLYLSQDNIQKYLSTQGSATMPALNFGHLKKVEVKFPSLTEQKRLVAILDEAFASIARARSNSELNLKNAKELFDSYLQSVFATKGQGWEEKCLDEIIESNITGLTKNSGEQHLEYKYKYVKMNNITRDNRFDLVKYTCVNATKEEASKFSLSEGDFLFNTRNSYELVGKTCLYDHPNDEVVLYNNNIMRIRFIKSINPYFINYSFTTKSTIKKLDSLKSGTTNVSAIYYKDLKNLCLLIPPLEDQQTIVQKLDDLTAETKKLEIIFKQKLNDLEELKKSMLQKAFNGELKTA